LIRNIYVYPQQKKRKGDPHLSVALTINVQHEQATSVCQSRAISVPKNLRHFERAGQPNLSPTQFASHVARLTTGLKGCGAPQERSVFGISQKHVRFDEFLGQPGQKVATIQRGGGKRSTDSDRTTRVAISLAVWAPHAKPHRCRT